MAPPNGSTQRENDRDLGKHSITPDLVSVIIPTRNRRDYLEESIESVRRQTHEQWEIIVIDDASEDDTWEWIQGQATDRIRCLRLAGNSGSTITRNAGLRIARGEFCLFLDDDDLLPENALAISVKALKRRPDAIGTLGCIINMTKDGVLTGGRLRPTPVRWVHHNIWRDIQFSWSFLVGASLFRATVIRSVGGFDESIVFFGDDIDLWLRIGNLGPVVLLPDAVIKWRSHGQTRPDNFVELLNDLKKRHAETWTPGRQAATKRIWRAHSAYFDLRVRSGQSGNWLRIARLMARMTLCPYLLASPVTAVDIWRSIRRDLGMDPWLGSIKRLTGRE